MKTKINYYVLVFLSFLFFNMQAQEKSKNNFEKDSIRVTKSLEKLSNILEKKDISKEEKKKIFKKHLDDIFREFNFSILTDLQTKVTDYDSLSGNKDFQYSLRLNNVIINFISKKNITSFLYQTPNNQISESDFFSNNDFYSKEQDTTLIEDLTKNVIDDEFDIALDCNQNIQEAKFYLNNFESITDKNFESIIDILTPCLKQEDSEAQYIMAKVYLEKQTEKAYKKAFKLLKESSKQENSNAQFELGVLYKYGLGCRLNYNKAKKWFKKSAKKGNSKAAYSLGYFYLKGFGNINQNYDKAIEWFKKSDYPMAKYWLGVCYKNGYGVRKNIQRANKFLETDFSELKNIETKHVELQKEFSKKTSYLLENNENEIGKDLKLDTELLGEWQGKLLLFDWSGKHVENKVNMTINISLDSLTGNYSPRIFINNSKISNGIVKLDNSLYFKNAEAVLPHNSYIPEIPSTLLYQIISANLKIKSFNNTNYLTGSLESYIEGWKEKGVPLRFVLEKVSTTNSDTKKLSEEVLQALSKQKSNFIKLYPNPFKKDLIIAYNLEQKAITKVQINDLNGNLVSVVKNSNPQEKGEHSFFYNASNLVNGAYVVSVFVNNKRKTRIIIKK